jgi:hypothetical protein
VGSANAADDHAAAARTRGRTTRMHPKFGPCAPECKITTAGERCFCR